MDDRKIVFALDIGTRSVVGIVGALKDGNFSILDYEQEFHEKRAMRDGQIEDIDLVARIANSVKSKLEQRSGQTFTKVSIAAAGRALRTASASFSYDLIPNEPITQKIIQYMEYSAIEKAQEAFLSESSNLESGGRDYYCVGYSVTDYSLDDYKIKNLEGQKGTKAVANIIAAFLPSSVLVSLYAVTARCGLEVDNLTLEPIAAIHAVVPDDVRFLNIALVDIGGGTSDIAISRDGSVIAYDMVTIAGDEITEALMQHYLTNFATAERIKLMLSGEEKIEFKDILGNQVTLTPDEAFASVKETINALADAISQRILLINGSAPAAVFLVGGGSQIRGLCKVVAEKLGMAANRVAIGVVNTDNNLSLFSESLYSPAFVTPIGIGIVSSLYRGCDFFAISVNGKRIMLVYTLNGVKKTVKGTPGIPGELLVNGFPATIETEIKQGDEITVTLAKNGQPPSLTLQEALSEFNLTDMSLLMVNDLKIDFQDKDALEARKISYMDQINVTVLDEDEIEYSDHLSSMAVPPIPITEFNSNDSESKVNSDSKISNVEINKIYSHALEQSNVSLLLADDDFEDNTDTLKRTEISVTLNGNLVHLFQETEEPLILMHLLKYADLDVANPKGELVLKINGNDANYADTLNDHDVAIIKWSEEI